MSVALEQLIKSHRFHFHTEADLQDGICHVLTSNEIPHLREVRLSHTDRVDFLAGEVGIEVKIDGATAAALRQLHRYAQSERIGALLLVTNRARHRGIPGEMNGKAVRVIQVGGGI